MNKKLINYFILVIGIILLVGGLILIKTIENPDGVLRALPYIFVGLGCGIFGHSMGNILTTRIIRKYPNVKKQMEIEENDERNINIGNRAKAKAYDMMIFVFGALMLSLALMNVDLMVVLMLVCCYLFVVGYGIYYRVKYDKEM